MRTKYQLIFFLFLLVSYALPGICRGEHGLWLPTYDAGVFDPARSPVKVKYQILKDADEVEVLVEDFRGQIVDRMNFVDLRAGDHDFSWKGKDENGEKLPDGRYRFDLRVEFSDGSSEDAKIEVRITTMPPETLLPSPKPIPPKKYLYNIDGSISTFYRRNTEDSEKKDEDGEQRVRIHFTLDGADRRADGVFSLRRPYSSETSYDASRAMVEQRWPGGKGIGVFRQGLGNLDDPMKLFSDFRTERKKVGAKVEHTYGWMGITALGFGAEGDVDSKESGVASRLTFGPPDGWKLGVNYARRRAVATGESDYRTSSALTGDVRLPLRDNLDLLMEYAGTKDIENRNDRGYLIKGEYDRGGLRMSLGYIDLGEHFAADFADPVRQVRNDARGLEMNADYFGRRKIWIMNNMAAGIRLFGMKKHSNDEKIKEGDASLRFGLGEKDKFLVNWFGREEGPTRTNTLAFSGRHMWNDSWSSGFQSNYSTTKTSYTWRWMLDTSLRQEKSSFRLSMERIRRVIEDSLESPFEESTLRFDFSRGPWRVNLMGKYSRRETDTDSNLFGRVEYGPEFLHRYRLITYLALGNRAAFKTEKQIELGVELKL